ncbi:MAG: aldehyde dehydrogenase family protein [Solirubrobacterales bacterium]|nr:aldehyde dehydrogenase family protein [Solirubrobacterales bacterium]
MTSTTPVPQIRVSSTEELCARAHQSLARCGVELGSGGGVEIRARSPITGEDLFDVPSAGAAQIERAIATGRTAFETWRTVPAPARGALVKRFGALADEHKREIAELITIEAGKIHSEALGEVQEVIDICDFAVGLSRQLDGRTMPSERSNHRLMETWHPLGVVAVISAFNFPAAVWSWNTAVALVCGNSVVWKPSPLTSLTSLACSALLGRAGSEFGAPPGFHQLVIAEAPDAGALVDSRDVALLSATGSERMGAQVAPRVAARLGRCLLELGGNNAAVVAPSADLELATRAIVFAAAGTAGQRCTTLRRLITHADIVDELAARLSEVVTRLPIGDPFAEGTLVGPLINERAHRTMMDALMQARADGGELLAGGMRREATDAPDAYYVEPAVVRMPAQTPLVRRETFAPILYVMSYGEFGEAIALHNDVPQGLSSSIFTRDQREAERFMAADGSDCGIVNVNIGTSGAEIGGAFGGEKSTGGGRESGSDAWRAYMRRATNTINYSDEPPLAQGVEFGS